jgi:transcriptional regulator with XRE-family HTH domain
MTTIEQDKLEISRKIRQLRQERRWTQAAFAKLLGLSQSRLSELEHGQGSFTAEQLLTILTNFNVPIEHFARIRKPEVDQRQNALARLGASHLLETETLPSEQIKDALAAIRETLVAADNSRHVAAIAPVIVKNINNINFTKLHTQLAELGLDRRLSWALENTAEALKHELTLKLPRATAGAYERARIRIKFALSEQWLPRIVGKHAPEDILDSDIASEKSQEETRQESSPISKRWRILTRIQVEDFIRALEAAR